MSDIGSRYQEGFVIAEWNTTTDGPDSADSHVVKRLFVAADGPKKGGEVDLVGYVEVEVVSIENGRDEGFIDGLGTEVYRGPFPRNVHARKQLLRKMREAPKFYVR